MNSAASGGGWPSWERRNKASLSGVGCDWDLMAETSMWGSFLVREEGADLKGV